MIECKIQKLLYCAEFQSDAVGFYTKN